MVNGAEYGSCWADTREEALVGLRLVCEKKGLPFVESAVYYDDDQVKVFWLPDKIVEPITKAVCPCCKK
jgi:hypothetical protein